MILLENEFVSASVAKKGAELQSLKNKKTKQEHIWSADPAFWGKHSPVLFPIVGGLRNDTYTYAGQEYHLPRHGFARDYEFEVQQISDTKAIFSLKDNEETLKRYPFSFVLSLHYELKNSSITCTYHVANPGKTDLLFSVGGHPAFATPTADGLAYTDYYLEFNKDTELVYHKLKNDLIEDETMTLPLNQGTLALAHQLFYKDALVFKTLKSDKITIRNHKNPYGLHFESRNFPFFGIWAAKDADFVCLEPWCGIADGISHNLKLEDKEGIQILKSLEQWERSWRVTSF